MKSIFTINEDLTQWTLKPTLHPFLEYILIFLLFLNSARKYMCIYLYTMLCIYYLYINPNHVNYIAKTYYKINLAVNRPHIQISLTELDFRGEKNPSFLRQRILGHSISNFHFTWTFPIIKWGKHSNFESTSCIKYFC